MTDEDSKLVRSSKGELFELDSGQKECQRELLGTE